MEKPREIIEYLLPHVVTAGAYSTEIQNRVAAQDAKDGATIFHTALSDADLTVQSYLEVVLLARFPSLNFYSEEQASSLNKKYFLGSSSLEVLLDPIDGTRAYLDGKGFYQIIVTLHDEKEIVGTICYIPRRNRCYTAIKGAGAFRRTGSDITRGQPGTKLDVTKNRGPILLFNSPDLVAKLATLSEVIDLAVAYTQEPGRYYSTDFIEGKARSVVHKSCQAIDGGALALIAAEAGALVTDFNGRPVGSFRTSAIRTLPNVVVSADSDVHKSILAELAR